jgi:hypothetical protein
MSAPAVALACLVGGTLRGLQCRRPAHSRRRAACVPHRSKRRMSIVYVDADPELTQAPKFRCPIIAALKTLPVLRYNPFKTGQSNVGTWGIFLSAPTIEKRAQASLLGMLDSGSVISLQVYRAPIAGRLEFAWPTRTNAVHPAGSRS